MKKIGTNPAQLVLWKEWKEAKDNFDHAVVRLSNATVALVEAKAITPKQAKAKAKEALTHVSVERKRLHRMVSVLSRRTNVEHNLIYRSLWAKLKARLGFDAEMQGIMGGKLPIETIEEAGHLPLAMSIAAGMA